MTGKGLILLFLSALVPLQGQQPLDVASIATLHQAGVPTAELKRLVTQHGVKDLDADGIQSLRHAGLDAGIVAHLDAELAKRSPKPVDLDGVVALVEAGVPESAIIERIRKTDSRYDLTIDQIVDLARRRVPASVIKEMRSRGKSTAKVVAAATQVTGDDVIDMSKAGIDPNEIIRRIRKTESRFDIVVDDLLDYSRAGVHGDVLKELWARRKTTSSATEPGAEPAVAGAATTDSASEADSVVSMLVTHREPSGGFSLNIPKAFQIYREGRNANSLVSFSMGAPKTEGLPDAELQVLRYRSRKPEWLVERNLENISQRFLTMLKANYVRKGLSLTYGDAIPTRVSGRPARAYRVGSNAKDGTSHEGRLVVTWQDDQVFVLSCAVRADLVNTTGRRLEDCLDSFTFEAQRSIAVPEGQDPVQGVFETWREAVTQRDFALYRELFAPGFDTTANRSAFVDLSNRLSNPDLRLTLGAVQKNAEGAEVECRIIGPNSTESLRLAMAQDGTKILLRSPSLEKASN